MKNIMQSNELCFNLNIIILSSWIYINNISCALLQVSLKLVPKFRIFSDMTLLLLKTQLSLQWSCVKSIRKYKGRKSINKALKT